MKSLARMTVDELYLLDDEELEELCELHEIKIPPETLGPVDMEMRLLLDYRRRELINEYRFKPER
jgi:hypothetical protein